MQKKRLTFPFSVCIGIEVLIASAIAVLTVLKRSDLVSPLFSASFIILFAFVALDIINHGGKLNITVMLAILCFFNAFANGVLEGANFSFDYFKKAIMFCSFIFLLYYASREEHAVSKKTARIVLILPVLAGSFMVISNRFLGNNISLGEEGALTLGFTNPNFTAMWLLHFLLFGAVLAFLAFQKGKVRKLCLLYLPVLFVLYDLISQTEARACLIAVIFFAAFLVLKPLVLKFKRTFALFVILFPIIYAVVYLAVVDTEWFRELFAFATEDGKTLNSRVYVWNSSFEALREHPILGSYIGIDIEGTVSMGQLHNTHVDVLVSYGIVPFILFLKILYDCILSVMKKCNSFSKYTALCAFFAVVISGTFEASIVSGAMGLNLLSVGLLALAKNDDTQSAQKNQIQMIG